MAEPEQRKVIAYTHTALEHRPRRLYSVGDISLPGLSIPGIFAGAFALAVSVALGMLIQGILGGPIVLLSVLVGLVAAAATYQLWGRTSSDLGGARHTVLYWVDYTFRQPRVIHGKGADIEPSTLHWQVIFWEPTDPGWIARRAATYQWLMDHAPEDSAIAQAKGGTR